jgi:formate dehydrogenase major subunit/formate dehydrogenase alpha subunit
MILTTGRTIYHYNTGVMTRKTKELLKEVPESYIEINVVDAENLKVADGDIVLVRSRRGEVSVRAKVTSRINPGIAFMLFHFPEGAANVLTDHTLDPTAKIPEYKVAAVSIRKAEG